MLPLVFVAKMWSAMHTCCGASACGSLLALWPGRMCDDGIHGSEGKGVESGSCLSRSGEDLSDSAELR